MQSIGLDIRVLSGDSKEIIIHDDDDDDDKVVRKKAEDMGVEVGTYGDHEVKAPEPDNPPDDEIIADDIDPELTDEEIDAQIKALDSNLEPLDSLEDFNDDIANITRFNRNEEEI